MLPPQYNLTQRTSVTRTEAKRLTGCTIAQLNHLIHTGVIKLYGKPKKHFYGYIESTDICAKSLIEYLENIEE